MSQLKLEKQLCFKLYSLNKNITKLYAPFLKKLELTYPQYLVMLVLWETSSAIPIKMISKHLDLDTGTLSPLLKRMENNGLIKRSRSEQDERTVLISLTNKGQLLKTEAKEIPSELFSMTGLDIEQMKKLPNSTILFIHQCYDH